MSTPGMIYLIGSLIAVAIFLRWAWREDKGRNVTLSDICFLHVASFFIGLFSWGGVMIWIFSKLSKYGDKVVIRRKSKEVLP